MATLTVTDDKAALALELGKAMNELRNHIKQYIQVKIRQNNINITFEMLEVMACLWKQDGINQQEIADQTMRDKSSMTYLIDNLVKRNMVKRVEDGNDRRNKLIYLTDKGKTLKEQLYPWGAQVYSMAAVNIDAGELRRSIAMLNQMTSNLKEQ